MKIFVALVAFAALASCASIEMRPQARMGSFERMESFANGFTASLGGLAEDTIRSSAWERKRRARLLYLAWQTGACSPEKNFRIVDRRVNWQSEKQPDRGAARLTASIDYVGLCVRDRGCIPPPSPGIRSSFVQEAIALRSKGQPYYQVCHWIDEDIRKLHDRSKLADE